MIRGILIGTLLMLSGQYVPSGSLAPSVSLTSAFVQGFTDPNFTFTTPHTIGTFGTTGGTTNATAGNAIIVVVTAANNFQSPVVSVAGTPISAVDTITSAGACLCGGVWAAFNIAGGASAVTISWTGGNSISSSSVAEYACTATCGVDVHTVSSVAWSNPETVGPLTATSSDIALTVLISVTNVLGTTFTGPTVSGYTTHNGVNDNNTTGRGSKIADKNIGSGSFSATWDGGAQINPSDGANLFLIGIHH